MAQRNDDDRDPGHTLEACRQKFGEVRPLSVAERDPGDEDDGAAIARLREVREQIAKVVTCDPDPDPDVLREMLRLPLPPACEVEILKRSAQ